MHSCWIRIQWKNDSTHSDTGTAVGQSYLSYFHSTTADRQSVFASCRTAVLRLIIFTSTLVQKFKTSNLKLSLINSLSFIQSTYYLHEMAEQEDMKRKRILLTATEKHGIVNYYYYQRPAEKGFCLPPL
jgi:hypothetical protein